MVFDSFCRMNLMETVRLAPETLKMKLFFLIFFYYFFIYFMCSMHMVCGQQGVLPCTCMCMWRPEVDIEYPLSFSIAFWDRVFTEPETVHLGKNQVSGSPEILFFPFLPCPLLQHGGATTPCFSMGAGELVLMHVQQAVCPAGPVFTFKVVQFGFCGLWGHRALC